jgi:hypothetical protein
MTMYLSKESNAIVRNDAEYPNQTRPKTTSLRLSDAQLQCVVVHRKSIVAVRRSAMHRFRIRPDEMLRKQLNGSAAKTTRRKPFDTIPQRHIPIVV